MADNTPSPRREKLREAIVSLDDAIQGIDVVDATREVLTDQLGYVWRAFEAL